MNSVYDYKLYLRDRVAFSLAILENEKDPLDIEASAYAIMITAKHALEKIHEINEKGESHDTKGS